MDSLNTFIKFLLFFLKINIINYDCLTPLVQLKKESFLSSNPKWYDCPRGWNHPPWRMPSEWAPGVYFMVLITILTHT